LIKEVELSRSHITIKSSVMSINICIDFRMSLFHFEEKCKNGRNMKNKKKKSKDNDREPLNFDQEKGRDDLLEGTFPADVRGDSDDEQYYEEEEAMSEEEVKDREEEDDL
jgi:hypothetical protein